MLLEALIARARGAATPEGCESFRAKWVLRLTRTGAFVELACLEEAQMTDIPKTSRGNVITPNTVIDSFAYLFGTGGAGCPVDHAQAYRDAYLGVLAQVDHPAAQALRAFLTSSERPLFLPMGTGVTLEQVRMIEAVEPVTLSGKETRVLPALVQRGVLTTNTQTLGAWSCVVANARASHAGEGVVTVPLAANSTDKILVEVEGYAKTWWLDARVLDYHRQRSRMVPRDSAMPACSLCYEYKPLARLFPRSSGLSGSLISFNEDAWEGYGQTQGYNAPTCEECAEAITRGLDDVYYNKGNRFTYIQPDAHMLWWAESGPAETWPLLETALDPETTDADAVKALDKLQDGHFMSVEKQQGRVALRRYAWVEAATVRANVLRWRQVCKSPVWKMEKNLDLSKEMLYLSIVANEPVPGRVKIAVRQALRKEAHDLGSWLNRSRAAFLTYASPQESFMSSSLPVAPQGLTDPMPDEPVIPSLRHCAYFGRVFARAEYVQTQRGRVQRSIRFTKFTAAQTSPQRTCEKLINSYLGYRVNGYMVEDKAMRTFIQELTVDPLPRRMSPSERWAFARGYYFQKALQQALQDAKFPPTETTPAS